MYVMMFPENPFAGLNKHELSKKKICHDAWSQTDEVRSDRDHPLFASLLQGLEEIVHTGLTVQSWDNRPALELHVHEADSSDHSSSESALEEIGEQKTGVSVRFGHCTNSLIVRVILSTWFDHLVESSFL